MEFRFLWKPEAMPSVTNFANCGMVSVNPPRDDAHKVS